MSEGKIQNITTEDILKRIYENSCWGKDKNDEQIKKEAEEKLSNIAEDGEQRSINILLEYYRDETLPDSPYCYYHFAPVYFYSQKDKISGMTRARSECADTMMSFWTPVCECICRLNDTPIKTGEFPRNKENIKRVKAWLKRNKEKNIGSISDLIGALAESYATRGNILLLPFTKNANNSCNMNNEKKIYAEDKIDQTLWHCFKGEEGEDHELSCYFNNNDKNLIKWIKAEHLECMFDEEFFKKETDVNTYTCNIEDSQIVKENIQPLVNGKCVRHYKFFDLKTNEEWQEFFENANKVIAYRNKMNYEIQLPFELDADGYFE